MNIVIAFGIFILLFAVAEGRRDGTLKSKRDFAVLAAVIAFFGGTGGLAYWWAGMLEPGDRSAMAIALFFAFNLAVWVVIHVVSRYKQLRRMKASGVISDREWIRRVDALLSQTSNQK